MIVAAVALAAEIAIMAVLERGDADAFQDKASALDTQSGQTQSAADSTLGTAGNTIASPSETDGQLPASTKPTGEANIPTQKPTEKPEESNSVSTAPIDQTTEPMEEISGGTTDSGVDNFGDVDWD